MTIQNVCQCFSVNGSLVLLLLLPFLAAASMLVKGRGWPEVVLLAMVFSCSLQASLGLFWSHLVKSSPGLEMFFFFLLCGVLSLCLYTFRKRLQAGMEKTAKKESHAPLFCILAAAFCLRSIYPLQTFALGQSDAYTHLHYLRFITEHGYLFNVVYPSGYHWLLALPVLVFKMDPYVMARFSGAFFGVGLVLAIYVFLYTLFDRRAAVFGSFCAACFPGMLLLMKTGVGAFANQLGLLFVPCMLCSYACLLTKKDFSARMLFVASAFGLAASVPMMLIHVFIIIGLERGISLFRERKLWLARTGKIVLFCLPAVMLIGFHFSQAGAGQRFQTAWLLVNTGAPAKGATVAGSGNVQAETRILERLKTKVTRIIVQSPYTHLVVDFFSVKRWGFSNVYLNTLSLILFALFLCCLGYGLYGNHAGFVVLGIWGGLTSVQAGAGFLQFTSYQRGGWSLLVATCCLSGIITGQLYRCFGRYWIVRVGTFAAMIISMLWTVQHPPAHPAIQSSAEDLIIRTVRFLAPGADAMEQCNGEADDRLCRLALRLNPKLPVTLVSRKFVGWHDQGEIIPNVLPPDSRVKTLLVNARERDGRDIVFNQDSQYVVFVDKEKRLRPQEITSAFAMVSPGLVNGVLQQQKNLYRANSRILEYISLLPRAKWQVHRETLSASLVAYLVIPGNEMKTEF